MQFVLLLKFRKNAHKMYVLPIVIADAIIVPSFTDVQMGNRKGFRFVDIQTTSTVCHSKKSSRETKGRKSRDQNAPLYSRFCKAVSTYS